MKNSFFEKCDLSTFARKCFISLLVDIANGSQYNRFLLSSLIANMATILINFQQILLRTFQHFAIKFLSQKLFLARLKSASKSLKSWQGKCDVFLLELYLAIDPSNFASKNDVTQLAEFQKHIQK